MRVIQALPNDAVPPDVVLRWLMDVPDITQWIHPEPFLLYRSKLFFIYNVSSRFSYDKKKSYLRKCNLSFRLKMYIKITRVKLFSQPCISASACKAFE